MNHCSSWWKQLGHTGDIYSNRKTIKVALMSVIISTSILYVYKVSFEVLLWKYRVTISLSSELLEDQNRWSFESYCTSNYVLKQ